MPRPQRHQNAGLLHHVISVGNNKQPLFKTDHDFNKYISLLNSARRKFPVKIYNFCLMGNHVHLLLEPTEEGSLSKFMEEVSKEYAKYFNKTHKRTGHVFGGRFKSFVVQEDRFLFACSRYIDINPEKLKIVSDLKKYSYSGHNALAYGKSCALKLDLHDLYLDLGSSAKERQIAYRAIAANSRGEDLDLMNRRAGILGDKEFKQVFKNR